MDDNELADSAYEQRAKALIEDLAKTMLIFMVLAGTILAWSLLR